MHTYIDIWNKRIKSIFCAMFFNVTQKFRRNEFPDESPGNTTAKKYGGESDEVPLD